MSTPTPIDPDLLRARLAQAVEPIAPSPDALRQIRTGIRRRKLRLSFGTGAGALLICGGAVALALTFGSPGNPQTAPITAAPGQTTASAAPALPTQAPTTTAARQTIVAPTSAPARALLTTAPASPGPVSSPALPPPAALVPALAGKKDFGVAKAVVATTGGQCLLVDRLQDLSGAPASAWVAKHPEDGGFQGQVGLIADVDGPSLLCLPLSSKPAIRLSVMPHGANVGLRQSTLDQLRHVLADPNYGEGAPSWFARVSYYRWHYDAKGAVDRVTAFWTP